MRNKPPKITRFPAKLFGGALILTGLVLFGMVWVAFDSYRNVTTAQLNNLRIEALRGTIVHLDEVLTMSARMAAATGDTVWEQRYRKHEPLLDAAIKEAMQLSVFSNSSEATAQTDAANLKLVQMEKEAFALVDAGKAEQARAVLFSEEYEAQKKIYAEGMIKLIQDMNQELIDNQNKQRRTALFSLFAVTICIMLLFLSWLSVLRKLNHWRAAQTATLVALTQAEEALQKLNNDLEERIEERTRSLQLEIKERTEAEAELEEIHKQLLVTSRQAGMAEIASNVLHNVGNVLNSVNVSAALAVDSVKRLRASGLAKIVEVIQEHSDDLGTFVTSDSRGKLLPAYLAQLSASLISDQEKTIKELDSLRGNIDHIKEIVAMQQSYAKVTGVKETICVTELVEDSLRMNVNALGRHGIDLIREFEAEPLINVDKHKVLQILVNLVRNAKHACDESGLPDKRLIMRVSNGADGVEISVIDNGVGIPHQNLERIFNHGFTTRKDGHGFGLHSSALAAKEMGGSLTVRSDGPGRGATFTLKLPY